MVLLSTETNHRNDVKEVSRIHGRIHGSWQPIHVERKE